jgi:ATP-binding protein involved in chromosome partitioning
MPDDLESQVWDALKTVRYPGMSRDIVSFGFVRGVAVEGGAVTVELHMSTHHPEAAETVRDQVERTVAALPAVERVEARLDVVRPQRPESAAQRAVSQSPRLVPEVRHVVAVASGKGGVGKSTVAVNLAVALAKLGHSTGLLDADIYGPSVPMMFGISERPRIEGNRILPFEKYGVKLMSLGFVVDADTPVIWRGPMVMKGIEQMLADVEWGALDFLIVDLPPGTGDAQLTITQKVPLSAAVIVTTPQDVALIDARKGLAMFRKVNVTVAGIVENMSGFVCPTAARRPTSSSAAAASAPPTCSVPRSSAGCRSTRRSSRAATPECRSSSPSPRDRTPRPSAGSRRRSPPRSPASSGRS